MTDWEFGNTRLSNTALDGLRTVGWPSSSRDLKLAASNSIRSLAAICLVVRQPPSELSAWRVARCYLPSTHGETECDPDTSKGPRRPGGERSPASI